MNRLTATHSENGHYTFCIVNHLKRPFSRRRARGSHWISLFER
jgi:hypothetical protein